MKDTISHCRQSLSILVKWLADTEGLVTEPKDLFDVEAYEKVAMNLYEDMGKFEIQQLVRQCRIVGLNRLATDFELSIGITILEDSQEQMNNQ